MRCEEHGQRVIGDLLDEDVGHIGDDDPGVRRRSDVDHVDPDAGEGDDHAAVQPFDYRPGEPDAPGGDDRVGVRAARHERLDGARVDLHEVDARAEDLELGVVAMDRFTELAARRQFDHDALLGFHGRSCYRGGQRAQTARAGAGYRLADVRLASPRKNRTTT